jgi:uncharacterized protein (TIGR02147 family)
MNPLFEYTDYRKFLKDYFRSKKKENKTFSLKILADRAGFKARDYILRVMNGSRNLSQSGAFMLSQALRLSEKEADYFRNLVGFNQAASTREKEFFLAKMTEIGKYGKVQKLRREQFAYLSEWYYSALRSLLPVIGFGDDYAEIGRFLDPPLTSAQVRKAIDLLVQQGLLTRDASGAYGVPESRLTAGDEVSSVALSRFHRQSLDLARRAMDVFSSAERDISGITMSLSREGFDKMKAAIQAFRKKAMSIADEDVNEERAYQLNLQLFPLSKRRKR